MLDQLKKRIVSAGVALSMVFGLAAPVYAAGAQTVPPQTPSEELPVIELLPGQTLEEALALENAETLSRGSTRTFTSSPGSTSYSPVGAVNRTYQWQVSNSKVLSITSTNNGSCTVRGVSAGTATVSCKVFLSYTSYDPRLGYMSRSESDFGGSWQVQVVDGSSSGGNSSGGNSSGGSSSGSSSSGGSSSGGGAGLLLGGAALVAAGIVLYHYADEIKAAFTDAFGGLTQGLPSAEETSYAAVYDYQYYRKNNADLQAVFGSDRAAYLEHFLTAGMAEGRQASADFNVQVYRASNPDLNAAFGSDLAAYYDHYMTTGKAEGRIAS